MKSKCKALGSASIGSQDDTGDEWSNEVESTNGTSCEEEEQNDDIDRQGFTTMMFRNLPTVPGFTKTNVLAALEMKGQLKAVDFIYSPVDFSTNRSMGYAFVNFTSHKHALQAKLAMHGFSQWGTAKDRACEVCWGESRMQGLALNIQHYRNSPVMHASIKDEYRPTLLSAGEIVAFPAPTKKIKAPRLRPLGGRKW